MDGIGEIASALERGEGSFTVEALANELRAEWIAQALRETNRESVRERLLPATLVVWLVTLMGLFRRTSYKNLIEKIDDTWWTRERWSPEKPPTTSAVTKARDRLGVEPMKHLFERSAGEWFCSTQGLVFHGRRTSAIDCSTMKTPDTYENDERFGRPGSSRGKSAFPQMRLAALVDVGTRLVRAVRHGPYRRAEIDLARELVAEIERGSLVLLDRHFLCYGLLWDIYHTRGADFVVRVPKHVKARVVRMLGPNDAIVEIDVPRRYRRERPDMPRKWILRQHTYRPEGGKEDIRLFTTLLDPDECPAEEIASLYHDRWEEETLLGDVKTHLCDCPEGRDLRLTGRRGATVNRPVVFRSKKPARVEQELYGILIAHNVVRKTMSRAAGEAKASPRRLSYTASLERIREATWDMMRFSTRRLPGRYRRMLKVIARARVPERPGRHYPRAVKIKMSNYPKKESRWAS